MRERRYVSVWLPNWPAQRLARQPGKAPPEPFIVARTINQKRLVYAVSRGAGQAGLGNDKTVALAQASVSGLTIVNADLQADEKALRRIALWALRYSPLVAIDEPDGLMLDTGGADHLLGSEEALLSDIAARLTKQGLCARIVVSSSRLLSWALARFSPEPLKKGLIVPEGKEAEAAGSLPIAALGMEPGTTNALRRLGFDLINQIFAAPKAGLALRFGTDLVRRLDHLVGREPETLEPVTAPELISTRMSFAEPIGHTAGLEGGLKHLANDLCRRLTDQAQGARTLDLRAHRVDNEITTLRIRTAAPTYNPEHICRLFGETLDRINPGFGIERIELAAPLTERVSTHQTSTQDEDRTANLAPLVDRINARIGTGQIFRMEPTERDVPERSFRVVGPLASAPAILWDRSPRPVQMIVPPEKIDVLALLPDHPPARFTWRAVQRRVVRADGPECIFGEWWESKDEITLTRDYYRVEDERGGRWWIFRARDVASGNAEWFIHGVFG